MVEPFRSDNDTASTRMFEGFMLGWLNWLKGYCQNLLVTENSRVLTNHLENEMWRVPFYTDSHDILPIRRLLWGRRLDHFQSLRFSSVAKCKVSNISYVKDFRLTSAARSVISSFTRSGGSKSTSISSSARSACVGWYSSIVGWEGNEEARDALIVVLVERRDRLSYFEDKNVDVYNLFVLHRYWG